MSKRLIIAIDGLAGSGKSTSAKLVAQKLGYLYIDTGAMYRAMTYLALSNNVLDDPQKLLELAANSSLQLKYAGGQTEVKLNDEDITEEIRSLDVNKHVSNVSKIKELRAFMVEKQREMGRRSSGVVMEGRDITTVVFPDADVKIFLTASLDERADRRVKEFIKNGTEVFKEEIKNNLSKRDKIDSSRKESPLTQAEDAVLVDTTNYTIEDQVNIILEEVKKAASKKGIKLNLNYVL